MDTTRHLDFDELMAGIDRVREAPANDGTVEAIVVRPRTNERLQVEECGVAHRFGNDALRFVNRPEGRGLRLRGVYARIVEAGKIAVGDKIRKIP